MSSIAIVQLSHTELRQLAVYWMIIIAQTLNRRERRRSAKRIARLDDRLATAFRRLGEIKSVIGLPEYDSLCVMINARLRTDPEHPLWWLVDDDSPKHPRLRVSQSDQGWIDVRLAADDESGIRPEELTEAISWANSQN